MGRWDPPASTGVAPGGGGLEGGGVDEAEAPKKKKWVPPSQREGAAPKASAPGGAKKKRWSKPTPSAPAADAASDLFREANAIEAGALVADVRSALVELPRGATGVEWGTDLSFVGVYVRKVLAGGAAEQSGKVFAQDQLVAINGTAVYDFRFDQVMSMLGQMGPAVSLEFFHGERSDLLMAVGEDVRDQSTTATVTVNDQGKRLQLVVKKGANLRDALVTNGVDVYRGTTAWTNCAGHQMCGTCIVDVVVGADVTNRKSNDEDGTLNLQGCDPSCRLSCVTHVYGDIEVTVRPDREGGFFGSATSGSGW